MSYITNLMIGLLGWKLVVFGNWQWTIITYKVSLHTTNVELMVSATQKDNSLAKFKHPSTRTVDSTYHGAGG